MSTNRTTVNPIGKMPPQKIHFVMVFMEAIRISVMFLLFFFQQGKDTRPALLYIIGNIELKLDCKVKIANQIAILQLDIFPKSHSPNSNHFINLSLFWAVASIRKPCLKVLKTVTMLVFQVTGVTTLTFYSRKERLPCPPPFLVKHHFTISFHLRPGGM